MNPETGEIRRFTQTGGNDNFKNEDLKSIIEIPKGWVGWNVDELVTVKGCAFRVEEVNIECQTITLKAISRKMTKK